MEEAIEMPGKILSKNGVGGGSYGKVRQSNFELLRIIAMLMIIGSHLKFDNAPITKSFGQIGVMLFLLISAYFLYDSKFKISSFLRIVFETVFYSILIFIVEIIYDFAKFGSYDFKLINLVRSVLVLFYGSYWFMPNYLAIYLIFPFLNLIAKKLNKAQFTYFLVVFIGIISLASELIRAEYTPDFQRVVFCLIWYIMVYFIGCYIKKYSDCKSLSSKKVAIVGGVFCLAIQIYSAFIDHGSYLMFALRNDYNLVFLSIFIFLFFKNLNLKNSKFINTVASTTLGVYLIHESSFFAVNVTKGLVKFQYLWDLKYAELVSLAVIIIFFIGCSLIDLARIYLLEKPFFKFLNKKCAKPFDRINNFFPYVSAEPETLSDTQKNSVWRFWEYIFASIVIYDFSKLFCLVYCVRYQKYLLPFFILLFASYVAVSVGVKFIISKKKAKTT